MNYLIDTHAFIWAISDTGKLSNAARKIITSNENTVFISVVSFWEIALKVGIKRFFLNGIEVNKLADYAREMDLRILELSAQECCSFAELPPKDNHKDPFDRMIIWQAISRGMKLVSKDGLFEQYKQYGLQLTW